MSSLTRFRFFLTLCLAAIGSAHAEEGSATKFYASENVRHESNLFRLSPLDNAQALIGRSSPAETISATTLGLKFDKEYSLQRVQIDISAVDYRYENFDYLNFSAINYRAGWLWSVTPHLHGNLTSSRDKTLNSFSDFLGFKQRNERINTSTGIDAVYEVGARWRLLGSLMQTEQTNRQPLTTESGSRQTVIDAGLRYEFPSGTTMGFVLRNYDGTYTDQAPSVANRLENAFTQNDTEVNMLWKLSDKTSANAALIYLRRQHANFSERNYSGLAGNTRLTWLISAKSALNVEWRRDISALQTSSFNYSTVDKYSIGPAWQLTAHTRLGMQYSLTNRSYGGDPGLGVILERSDSSRDASLVLGWRPFTSVDISTTLQNSRRSANDPGLSYKNNSISVTARFIF